MFRTLLCLIFGIFSSCSRLSDGKSSVFEKHGDLFVSSAASLASSGALLSLKTGSGILPGVLVGSAASGLLSLVHTESLRRAEENLLNLEFQTNKAYLSVLGQQALADHMTRRKLYHPARDIFPASLFFEKDTTTLSQTGKGILMEISALNKGRLVWSRFGIIVYVHSKDPKNSYSQHLAASQAKAIGSFLVQLGVNPRRVSLLGAIIDRPLIDAPAETQELYYNAVEFLPIDLYELKFDEVF